MMPQFDNAKQGAEELKKMLDLTDIPLANMLGVTERSLNTWKLKPVGDLPPKAYRLKRLWEVIKYIHVKYPTLTPSQRRSILDNGRVTIDPNDPDDGTTSLINYIRSHPKDAAYTGQVDEAIADYDEDEPLGVLHNETTRSVQHP